jgi:putative ABC transport system permease protein
LSEIGFAFLLLVGAALMTTGFRNLATMNQGFDPGRVLSFRVPLPESEYGQSHEVVTFYQEALRRISALPEIQSAAVISNLPALAESRTSPVSIEGQPLASPDQPLLGEVRVTSEDYFRTMAIPVAAGRAFSRLDSEGALPVAVISRSAARRFWPRQAFFPR